MNLCSLSQSSCLLNLKLISDCDRHTDITQRGLTSAGKNAQNASLKLEGKKLSEDGIKYLHRAADKTWCRLHFQQDNEHKKESKTSQC